MLANDSDHVEATSSSAVQLKRRRTFTDAAVLLFTLTIAILSTDFPMPLIDDALITLRHSENLVDGHGLVFNPGERVLGTSSPVYALLIAALLPFFDDPVAVAVYSWPIALAAAGFLIYRMTERGVLGLVAAVVLCTDPSLSGIVGMETTFYVAMLLLVVALFQAGRLGGAALVLGVLPMVRPDGIFLAPAAALTWLIENRDQLGRRFFARHARLAVLFLIPLALWCAIATAYYGHPLPNSFIAKYYQGKITWWYPDSWAFRSHFADQVTELRYPALVVGSLLGLAIAFVRNDRVLRTGLLYLAFYLGAYSISRVPAYPNYFFPPFAMMTLVSFRALRTVVAWVEKSRDAGRSQARIDPAKSLAALAVSLGSLAYVYHRSDLRLLAPLGPPNPEVAYVKIAKFLRTNVPVDAFVGVMEIGIIGYYSGAKIVDFAGLVTADVMREVAEGDRRFAVDELQPEYVVSRYPVPLALEGGLTEGDLAANYKFLFGADGVGVFEALGAPEDVTKDADLLNAHPGTVFIPTQRVDTEQMKALDRAVAPHGSLFVRSLSGSDRDIEGKGFAYVSFRERHVDAVEPILEAQDVTRFTDLPRFEFDSPGEVFHAWHDVTTTGSSASVFRLATESPGGYLSVPILPFAPWFAGRLKVRYRIRDAHDCANGDTNGALFWITEQDQDWGVRGKTVAFHLEADGDWHELEVELADKPAWNGSGIVSGMRYDPVSCVAKVDIDSFRFE